MYYYRQLPALNAVFNVTPYNFSQTLLTQVGTPVPLEGQTQQQAIEEFIGIDGQGRLFFDQFFGINVENFNAGHLTAIPASSAATDSGFLWFHGDLVDYDVTAENWNDFDERVFHAGAIGGPVLWFNPQIEATTHEGPSGTNQITVTFPGQLVNPDTGTFGARAVTEVLRIRSGVETIMDISFTDTEPGNDGVYVFGATNNSVDLAFNNTVQTTDLYIISANTRPVSPGSGIGKQTAFDTETDDTVTVAGVRTSFNFNGHVNPSICLLYTSPSPRDS